MLETRAALERRSFCTGVLFSRKRHKNFGDVILLLYKGEKLAEYHNDPRIALIANCFEQLPSPRMARNKKY